jgi:predicted ATP-grasp superfamily ATP-dependent carboligase
MSVLVTPGNLRSTLAVTRSLGRQGIPVTVADAHPRSIAGVSRYCRTTLRVPSPARAGAAFVRAIQAEVESGRHRVVIPTDDIALALITQARAQLDELVMLPFPGPEVVEIAHDKGALASVAAEHGIPAPRSVVIREPADLDVAVRRVGFPAVVKARVSRMAVNGAWKTAPGTYYVNTRTELETACRAVEATIPCPIVQEYIPGEGRGVFVLMNRGRLRAAFAHRRIREKPPSGGVSVLSESVALDAPVLEQAGRLLEALKWHGVAMVEFKRDARDGVSKLLEINGRFWGSLQLAVDAGVDFPFLLYQLAIEGDVKPVFDYEVGVRLRWWLGDVDWLLLRLREPGLAGRLGAIREFLRQAGWRARGEVLRSDDPVPGLLELAQYLRSVAQGAMGRRAS